MIYQLVVDCGLMPDEAWHLTLADAALISAQARERQAREWDRMAQLLSLVSRAAWGKKGKGAQFFHPYGLNRHVARVGDGLRAKVREAFAPDTLLADIKALRERRQAGKGIANGMKLAARKWKMTVDDVIKLVNEETGAR